MARALDVPRAAGNGYTIASLFLRPHKKVGGIQGHFQTLVGTIEFCTHCGYISGDHRAHASERASEMGRINPNFPPAHFFKPAKERREAALRLLRRQHLGILRHWTEFVGGFWDACFVSQSHALGRYDVVDRLEVAFRHRLLQREDHGLLFVSRVGADAKR